MIPANAGTGRTPPGCVEDHVCLQHHAIAECDLARRPAGHGGVEQQFQRCLAPFGCALEQCIDEIGVDDVVAKGGIGNFFGAEHLDHRVGPAVGLIVDQPQLVQRRSLVGDPLPNAQLRQRFLTDWHQRRRPGGSGPFLAARVRSCLDQLHAEAILDEAQPQAQADRSCPDDDNFRRLTFHDRHVR